MAVKNVYVDADGNWALAQDGLAALTKLQGPFGLQKAWGSALTAPVGAAGDTILAEGSACRLDRLVRLTFTHNNPAEDWVAGDGIENDDLIDGAPGDHWTGVITEMDLTNHYIYVETVGGKYYSDVAIADGVYNTTQTESDTVSARATVPLYINTAVGTVAARLTIKGCPDDDSWSPDGVSRVKLDANDAVANCISANGGADYWTLANFELAQATGDGIDFVATTTLGVNLENIWSHDHGAKGFDLGYWSDGVALRCRAELNNTDGFYCGSRPAEFASCESLHNGAYGLNVVTLAIVRDSIFHGNTSDNIYMGSTLSLHIYGSVVDGAGRHGINNAGGGVLKAMDVRITNNGNAAGEYGLNMATGAAAFLRHTLFTGNRGNPADPLDQDIGGAGAAGVVRLDVGGTDTNILDGAAAPDDGYTLVDATHHDFNLTSGARLRSVANLLPDA